jgi:serine/threonine-protein kinase
MDPVRWQQVESICGEALEQDPRVRAAWLKTACAGDEDLEAEVARLLDAHEADPEFLERPVADAKVIGGVGGLDDGEPPEQIGAWRITGRLGRGGMGAVYVGTRDLDGVAQMVAVKVVRRGMDTAEILSRFRQERRILAGLDHPNIARLLDAGASAEGRPYFVMEHVDGLVVDEYCDQHRLSVKQRLRLFLVICAAVQHAHERLVVHRDLKPRNILVTSGGVVKLLDFGIGKILATDEEDPAIETSSQARLLTPDYAAPEQVTGGAVTPATDVYSLGVLLYQLLTGHHPYREAARSRAEIERAVLETSPRRPSTVVTTGISRNSGTETLSPEEIGSRRATDPTHLRRQLAGDLDDVVLKALRKEPERRYSSVASLADDIRRHLDGHPVQARPDTLSYRTGKFIARNAGWVAAATAAFLALGATTAVTLVQSRRVEAEATRVVAERDKAMEVRSFLMEMFGASGASQAVGDTVSVRRLLDLQVANLSGTYQDRPELKAEMLEVLADAYDRLGLMQAALPLAQEALDLRRGMLPPEDPSLGSALNLLGWITHETGKSAEAEPILREAIEVRRGTRAEGGEDLSRSLNDLGVVLNALGRYPEADSVLSEALAIRLAELGPDHRSVGITGNNLAAAYYYQGRLEDAIRAQEIAVQAIRKSLGSNHQRTVVAMSNLASFRRTFGDWVAAESTYRELLAIESELQGPDHPVTARTRTQVAQMLLERGMDTENDSLLAEAEREYHAALMAFESAMGPDHPQVGVTLSAVSLTVSERGRNAEALTMGERALRILEGSLGLANPNTLPVMTRLALVRWRLGQVEDAIALQRQAVTEYEAGPASTSPEAARAEAALCEFLLGRNQPGDGAEAVQLCSKAAGSMGGAVRSQSQNTPYIQLRLVQAFRVVNQNRAADSLLAVIRPAIDSLAARSGKIRILLDSLRANK